MSFACSPLVGGVLFGVGGLFLLLVGWRALILKLHTASTPAQADPAPFSLLSLLSMVPLIEVLKP